MSLINEALKKAQRERTEEPADSSAPAPAGGARIAKRGKATRATTLVLVGSGALVLVVLSVVITVVWLNRPSTSAPKPTHAATPTPAAAPTSTPIVAPIVVAPVATPTITPPTETPATATESVSTPPASVATVETPPSALAKESDVAVTPASETPTATPTPSATPDERVAAFVEAVRVAGIRSSGAESRVLMNERVYRVNDIVERTLNIRLTAVGANSLTFTDANGVTYVKYF